MHAIRWFDRGDSTTKGAHRVSNVSVRAAELKRQAPETLFMLPPSAVTLTLIVLSPLLVWRVYARFKRMVGRQRLSKVRPWITLTIFPALTVLLLFVVRANPERLWAIAGGLMGGAALGVYGLRKTKFEPTKQGLFYTPNAHLGIALSLLFVGRLVYRLVEVFVLAPHVPHGMNDFARSPLTLGVFGLLAGYYIAYAIGLLRWRFRVIATQRHGEIADKAA